MEIDPAAQRLGDPDKDPDGMGTSLENPLSNDRTTQKPPDSSEADMVAEAEPASRPQQPGEDTAVSKMSRPPAQAPSKSLLTQNLLSLYGLQSLAESVARTDPVTGEKINKMRKSYEGKVKTFGLAGRNKAAKCEAEKSTLLSMVQVPDEEWNLRNLEGKEVQKGFSSGTLEKLEKAMQMQPGPLPDNSKWEEVLGIDKPKPVLAGTDPKIKSSTLTAQTNGMVNGNRPHAINTQITSSEAARPKRTAKKRRYDDSSFEGYAEGFMDDEADIVDAGEYSSGDGTSRGNASKKRKMSTKDFGATSPTLSDRTGSYGVGMLGVGR